LDIAVTPGGSFVVSLVASPTGAKVTAICALLKDSQYSWITLDRSVANGQVSHKELKPEDLAGKKIGVQSDGQRYVDFVTQSSSYQRISLRFRKLAFRLIHSFQEQSISMQAGSKISRDSSNGKVIRIGWRCDSETWVGQKKAM